MGDGMKHGAIDKDTRNARVWDLVDPALEIRANSGWANGFASVDLATSRGRSVTMNRSSWEELKDYVDHMFRYAEQRLEDKS